MIRVVVIAGMVASMLVQLPGLARADDRSLREAGRSRDAQFVKLGRETRRAFARWTRSGYRRPQARRLVHLQRRARSELDLVVAAVTREQPSSAGGETYKRKLLQSLDAMDAALRWDIRGVRARTNGRVGRASRAFRRADRLYARARRLEREAVKAIEGDGSTPNAAVRQASRSS
jgi:hypothetical protein